MSYSAFWRSQNFSFPTGFAALAAGLFYLNTFTGRPTLGTREITNAEYNATPLVYLQEPEQHPSRFPKVPGMKDVPALRAELYHKAEGHGHHHH